MALDVTVGSITVTAHPKEKINGNVQFINRLSETVYKVYSVLLVLACTCYM